MRSQSDARHPGGLDDATADADGGFGAGPAGGDVGMDGDGGVEVEE